jgi:CBS domain containing-hemolysin-like protein
LKVRPRPDWLDTATPIDILEAIAGEFPDEDEQPVVQQQGPGRWRVDGTADLHYLQQLLETNALVSENDEYTSLAGFMLERIASTTALFATGVRSAKIIETSQV